MILEVYPLKTQKSFYEQNGGTYTKVGDVLLPDLVIGEAEQKPIGIYGRKRGRFLKEQHPVLFDRRRRRDFRRNRNGGQGEREVR